MCEHPYIEGWRVDFKIQLELLLLEEQEITIRQKRGRKSPLYALPLPNRKRPSILHYFDELLRLLMLQVARWCPRCNSGPGALTN